MEAPKIEDASNDNETFAPEYRDRLRTWLEKMINSGNIPGLCWENKEQTIFRMPWKHAGRQDYNLEEDSKIFMAWAIHSGRYREGVDKPEPIVWKTRLRCALNKMPDIRELPERSRLDISEPYRVYQLLPPVHKASQIRRRLYKRSQSHETDHVKPYGEPSRAVSLVNIPENEKEWSKQAIQRRNSSIETSAFNLAKPRSSPLTSGTSALTSPGFWLGPQSVLPLKYPVANGLTGGFPIPQALAMDPTNSRYPLVPSLTNPFANYSSSNIHPFLSNPATFDLLKRSNFMNQSMISSQKYQEHLSNLTKHLKGKVTPYSDDSTPCIRELNRENAANSNVNLGMDEVSVKFSNMAKSDLASNNNSTMNKTFSTEFSPDNVSVEAQLNKCQHKIETLEQDLKESMAAHAQERREREELEKEKEKLKKMLEYIENFFQPKLEQHASQEHHKALFFNSFEDKVSNQLKMAEILRTYRKYQNGLRCDKNTFQFSTPTTHSSSFPTQPKQEREKRCYSGEFAQTKRPSSPLDLTVPIPEKKRKESRDDDARSPEFGEKYSPLQPATYVKSAFVTSSRSRVLSNNDKRPMTSPSSPCRNSPVNVVIHGRKEKTDFSATSLSPIPRNSGLLSNYPQRQGTIQVT